jgi:hypothetical protein
MAVIVPVVSKFDDKGIKKAKSGFSSLSKSIKGTVAALGIGLGVAGIVRGFSSVLAAAEKVQQSNKRLEQVAKSMNLFGSATKATTDRLKDYADSLERSTGVEAETIKLVQAKLLTFRELGNSAKTVGGQFDQATLAALNLAAAGFGTAESNAVQLGKALQDPVKGINALARAGVTFTAEEKNKIKTLVESNRILDAQKLILGALETQVGGVAASTATATDRMRNAFGQVEDAIGLALLPAVENLSAYFASTQGQKTLEKFAENLGEIAVSISDLAQTIVQSGVIDKLADFVEIAAKVAKLDFKGVGDTLNENVYKGWIDKYINNRSQFDKDMEVLIENERDYYNRIQAAISEYVKSIVNNQGKFGSIRAIERAAEQALSGAINGTFLETGNKNGEKGLTAAKKSAEAAKKAAAEAARVAKESAEALRRQTEALADFSKELMGLADGVKPLIDLGREIGKFEQSAVDSFDAIAKSIENGVANGTIIARAGKNLLDYVATERKALTAIAQKRDELASKRGLAEVLIGDVKAAVVGFASITDLVNKETGNLTSNFADVVSKTKAFASQLKQLRELGLDKNLYKQIVDAGIDAGGATAAEIIAGGAGTVSELNNLFVELERAGAAIAEDTALVMFNNGVEVAGGLVAGLLSQEQALVEAAQTLADAFTKTFDSMITNLKVPSQEVEQITLSLADIAAGNTGIAGANSNITRSLAGNYLRRTGGEGAQTITITVKAGLGTDGKAVGQAIQAELNKYNRSNVALV